MILNDSLAKNNASSGAHHRNLGSRATGSHNFDIDDEDQVKIMYTGEGLSSKIPTAKNSQTIQRVLRYEEEDFSLGPVQASFSGGTSKNKTAKATFHH